MKKLIFSLLIIPAFTAYSQTTWPVCVTEVEATGGSSCTNTAVFTPANLNIAVGDKIEFTTFMVQLAGYNGTHDIQFTGLPANNVLLPISTDIFNQVTTVTTPAFNTPGVYPMECVNSNHCFIADLMSSWLCTGYSVTVGTITEIEEERMKKEVNVYPNPSSGLININLLPIKNNNPKVYIMDVVGKTVAVKENNAADVLSIDASSFNKGIYFVKIVSDNGAITKKIVVE